MAAPLSLVGVPLSALAPAEPDEDEDEDDDAVWLSDDPDEVLEA